MESSLLHTMAACTAMHVVGNVASWQVSSAATGSPMSRLVLPWVAFCAPLVVAPGTALWPIVSRVPEQLRNSAQGKRVWSSLIVGILTVAMTMIINHDLDSLPFQFCGVLMGTVSCLFGSVWVMEVLPPLRIVLVAVPALMASGIVGVLSALTPHTWHTVVSMVLLGASLLVVAFCGMQAKQPSMPSAANRDSETTVASDRGLLSACAFSVGKYLETLEQIVKHPQFWPTVLTVGFSSVCCAHQRSTIPHLVDTAAITSSFGLFLKPLSDAVLCFGAVVLVSQRFRRFVVDPSKFAVRVLDAHLVYTFGATVILSVAVRLGTLLVGSLHLSVLLLTVASSLLRCMLEAGAAGIAARFCMQHQRDAVWILFPALLSLRSVIGRAAETVVSILVSVLVGTDSESVVWAAPLVSLLLASVVRFGVVHPRP